MHEILEFLVSKQVVSIVWLSLFTLVCVIAGIKQLRCEDEGWDNVKGWLCVPVVGFIGTCVIPLFFTTFAGAVLVWLIMIKWAFGL